MNQDAATIVLKVRSCARLSALMAAVKQFWNIEIDDFGASYEGETTAHRVDGDLTVGQLGLQQGTLIQVFGKQAGC